MPALSLECPLERGPELLQPPLTMVPAADLHVAISGLALGGAERIVLDWAERVVLDRAPWTPHLIVLRNHAHEWTVPSSLNVTRLDGVDLLPRLTAIGSAIARSGVPVCVCHLLTARERQALAAGGAFVVPVIHNARAGWLEPASALDSAQHIVAVSESAAADVNYSREGRHMGRPLQHAGTVSVIRHLPRPRRFQGGARARWRAAWRIPADALVIGMIGAVKPQKDYPFAVRLLAELLQRRDVYLVIVGGPIGKQGRAAWMATLAEMRRCGVRHRLAMPGFVPDAAACLPAFDLLLNTSRYEGLSVATLEARVNRVPVVASRVGGQAELVELAELGDESLTLVDKHASSATWCEVIVNALGSPPPPPARSSLLGGASHRLWTLAHLARPFQPGERVLFVTANLNAGGAQRSLVNLLSTLRHLRHLRTEVAVTGNSTAGYFFAALAAAGVPVMRTASTRDPFDHAEVIVQRACAERVGTVCFWNVDPKIKLLVTKALAFTGVRLVDVSPGPASFAEMRAAEQFGRLAAFSEDEYYHRLDRLVLKYRGTAPASCAGKIVVIPNGVNRPARAKTSYAVPAGSGRVAVNGRIAPSKFLVEIVEAMSLVRDRIPACELHIFGGAEPRHAQYAHAVRSAAADAAGRVFFHGAGGRTIDALADFDAFVVLGQDQGSPNALLEALAAGLPCIANDDGGTTEQIQHERTGLVVADRSPRTLARAIERILVDRSLAARLAAAGRRHVLETFSLELMAARYEQLFASLRQEKSA